ncbi:MAG: toll/interleukin-1 receptor domain-containing protein [Nitrospira sp.]|nr:toll/interleukin-1 receptor domain-containing protein [Nitrospira sp.]
MIWSAAFEDSEWCRAEYTTLESKEKSGSGFRYVIAKVDEASLPGFASAKIHVDFSQDRDGPSGSGLLRLRYGMNGDPLPPATFRLAADVDKELKTARVQIKAERMNGFISRPETLSQSTGLSWQTSPALGCEVAEAMIGLGNNTAAFKVLNALQQQCPRAVRPKQLDGLALVRNKDWKGAQPYLASCTPAANLIQKR